MNTKKQLIVNKQMYSYAGEHYNTITVDAYIHTSYKPVLYSSTTQAIKIMVRHPASADDIVLSSTAAVIWISEIDALRSAHFAVVQLRDATGTSVQGIHSSLSARNV